MMRLVVQEKLPKQIHIDSIRFNLDNLAILDLLILMEPCNIIVHQLENIHFNLNFLNLLSKTIYQISKLFIHMQVLRVSLSNIFQHVKSIKELLSQEQELD